MNFSSAKAITIPEGNVVQIEADGNVLWKSGPLPSAYQQVEWIGTDGNAYFVSNFNINNLDKFTVYYTFNSPAGNNYMFGATHASSATGRFLHRYEGLVVNYNASSAARLVFNHDSQFHSYKIQCEHQGEIFVYEGDTLIAQKSFYNTKGFEPFGIFCNNYNKTPTSYRAVSNSKISELRFVDDTTGNEVFNIIPCYRKADGVIGMYDIVSKTFFTNEGTGSFTKGADV